MQVNQADAPLDSTAGKIGGVSIWQAHDQRDMKRLLVELPMPDLSVLTKLLPMVRGDGDHTLPEGPVLLEPGPQAAELSICVG